MKPSYTGQCVPRPVFSKWFKAQIARNIDHTVSDGKSIRDRLFTVTEKQVNDRFKLVGKTFEPGQVAAHLEECGLTIIRQGEAEDGGLIFAVRFNNDRAEKQE